MGILVRDETIDRQVRQLAKLAGTSLQGAIGLAVARELERREQRRKQITEAIRVAQSMLAKYPRIDDGMTDREFFDREYGDI